MVSLVEIYCEVEFFFDSNGETRSKPTKDDPKLLQAECR